MCWQSRRHWNSGAVVPQWMFWFKRASLKTVPWRIFASREFIIKIPMVCLMGSRVWFGLSPFIFLLGKEARIRRGRNKDAPETDAPRRSWWGIFELSVIGPYDMNEQIWVRQVFLSHVD